MTPLGATSYAVTPTFITPGGDDGAPLSCRLITFGDDGDDDGEPLSCRFPPAPAAAPPAAAAFPPAALLAAAPLFAPAPTIDTCAPASLTPPRAGQKRRTKRRPGPGFDPLTLAFPPRPRRPPPPRADADECDACFFIPSYSEKSSAV
jgi:hypothetical protein